MTATVESSVGQLNLEVAQGATFDTTLTWTDAADALVDLTAYTAKMHIREKVTDTVVILELTDVAGITLGGAAGTIRVVITAAQTTAIPAGSYVYDLELISPASVVTRLVEGCAHVSAEVTR